MVVADRKECLFTIVSKFIQFHRSFNFCNTLIELIKCDESEAGHLRKHGTSTITIQYCIENKEGKLTMFCFFY